LTYFRRTAATNQVAVSQALEAVLSQALLPLAGGKGRIAAFEIMIANAAVRNLIRDERTFELHNVMQLCSAGRYADVG